MSVLTQPRDQLGVRQMPVADNRHVHGQRGDGVPQRQRQSVTDHLAHHRQLDRLGYTNAPEADRRHQYQGGHIIAKPFCQPSGDSAAQRMSDQREVVNVERRQGRPDVLRVCGNAVARWAVGVAEARQVKRVARTVHRPRQVFPAHGAPVDALLPRTWIALLRGRVRSALAATTGVEDATDVAKYLLAGADVVMTASALLRHGPEHATVLLDGLAAWMARKGFNAVDELRGLLSVPPGTDEDAFERAGYVTTLRAANAGAYTPW